MTRRVPADLRRRPRRSSCRCCRLPGPLLLGAPRRAQRRRSTRRCSTSSAGCRPSSSPLRYVIYGVDLQRRSRATSRKKSREQDETGDPKLSETDAHRVGPGDDPVRVRDLLRRVRHPDVARAEVVLDDLRRQLLGLARASARSPRSRCIVLGIQRNGRLTHSINAEHYHDIGKWMFAFTFFWAYTAFSPVHAAVVRQHAGGDGLVQVPACSASGSG